MAKKSKKGKIPKSIFELKWGPKKFAKKNNIRLKGKGMGRKKRKEAQKKLLKAFSSSAIVNLNKAVKILAENPNDTGKRVTKVKSAVENVVFNKEAMKRIAKLYGKNPKEYPNMIFLPYMITNTIRYHNQEGISAEEKAEAAERLDQESLLLFCEKILKRQIRHYRKAGLDDCVAFEMANVIPTTKLLKNSRQWYKNLQRRLHLVAEHSSVDISTILSAVRSVDKKKAAIDKKTFLEGFFSEFILTKGTNKSHTYNDTQKELHENLIEATLEYLESLKERKLREILKMYIKRRKSAEANKNDTKRVIRFIDHANSNSRFTRLKNVVQDLISDNSNNELYLS